MTGGFDQLGRELMAAEARIGTNARRSVGRWLVPGLGIALAVIVAGAVLLTGAATRIHHRAPSVTSPGAAPAASGRVRQLPCHEAAGGQAPTRDLTVVLGVVALPASPRERQALQTALSGSPDPAQRLFSKWGLVIRTGVQFRVMVAPAFRDRVSIGWGNANEDHVGTTITINRCRAPGVTWLDFAGGAWVHKPLCATLIVESHGEQRSVQVGIGKACPGQLPPPSPTHS